MTGWRGPPWMDFTDGRRGLRALIGCLLAAIATSGRDGAAAGQPVAAREALAEVQATATAGLSARAAALVLSGQEAGDLPVAMLALPLAAREGGSAPILVIVDLDGAALRTTAGEASLPIDLYLYALDEAGSVRAHLTQAFGVDPAQQSQRLARGGVKFVGQLELPAGAYTLRLLVVERSSDRYRLRSLPLTVPAGPTATGLFVAAHPPGDWLVVRQGSASPGFVPGPTLGFGSWLPGAGSVVVAGERVGLAVASATESGEKGWDLPNRGFEARLQGEAGEPVAVMPLRDLQPAGTLAGIDWSRAELPIAGVPPGHYRLRLAAAGDDRSGPALELRVVDRVAAGSTGYENDASEVAAAAVLGLAANGLEGDGPRTVYAAALWRLSEGDPHAVAGLAATEDSLLAGGGAAATERLTRGFAAVAAALAGHAPEAVLPLIAHHEALVREHYAAGRYLLARHSRRLLGRLLDLYSATSGSPRAPRLVADARLALGGHLLAIGAHQQARQLCERAIDVDPSHSEALLLLAAIDEALGDYPAAVRRLRPVVETGAGPAEAALRLAVNLRRTGDPAAALPLLRGLTGSSGWAPAGASTGAAERVSSGEAGRAPAAATAGVPGWVEAVAHQELADLLVEAGDAVAAVRVLEAAAERWPELEQLSIQLLATLDRLKRPAASRELLARLGSRPAAAGETPRLIYSRWPTAGVDAARHELASAAAHRLPQLAEALAESGLLGDAEAR